MSVDLATVKRVAALSRIRVSDERAEELVPELNTILGFVEQLQEVDVEGVEPMTSVVDMDMRKRADVVTDGEMAEAVTANAPGSDDNFFAVPKVVE
ncbi:Asp-tRNA(Asn)/Glu-tRNA(Gln) amidotransferase subunit GatC [Ahrensia sp. R2A130]|uniref:Asp-tRNA(Asn)/Glu-tRNA(Gln) amidotransferase subunit GatC n=1 Tax=Ahrensia sp. R2A130 TaxID=744979 RepID=UPI0001E0D0A0|nr:Asp-tRNA(Asn)/Glu-tRNA(Gln) amidotransferase subunit GatC [Ahrensia sp. R2A130]EFL90287.1 glutamyl-tRNA(Gln) amidotransferase, C subunit [Ahrensia sp. R2A130]